MECVQDRHISRINVERLKLIIKATEMAPNSASSIYREKMMLPWDMRELMLKHLSSSAGARETPG
jgi:hypothetical protein